MRLRNIPNARKTMEQHPELAILEPSQHRGRWSALFGNANPIHLEIGTGKGKFICGMAEQVPDTNFLGLEKYDSVMCRALQRLIREPHPNAMLLRGEAENLLDYFALGEIERVYLNFSDPWPKKCNIKRRLTHRDFLDKYKAIMPKQGEVHIKTDNRKLFEFTLRETNEFGMAFDHICIDFHEEEPEDNIRTEYEISRSAAGSKIYQLISRF